MEMQMVIVGDDCALPPCRGIIGRRGLAGTVLVNKVLLFLINQVLKKENNSE
jgi:dihydroxyacetone kinase